MVYMLLYNVIQITAEAYFKKSRFFFHGQAESQDLLNVSG